MTEGKMVGFTIERQPDDSKLLVLVNGNAFHVPDTRSVEALLRDWGCSLEQIEEAIQALESGAERFEVRQRPRLNEDQLQQLRAQIDTLRQQAGKTDEEIANLAGFPSVAAVRRAYEEGEASPI